ncbi:hypothetical protein DEU56DRAFT_760188 [Suillus clintonianus]|uniref:uncharacterized protein n=1 Tax=Suillus clintonianus TaxID=1904413 RepID=UPI001B882699|nr:uncharacterized protein DEU56DRAFT_760188 [Suillus clintonianus]KAG2122911.1 hypothetical protein DEU56DRAFT_760188 [Suillus clintonianus]
MALIARRYITSDRYNPSKKRSSKQKAHLISLNSKTHTEKENNPNFGNTTPRPVTRTQNELAVQQEKAITYERRYRTKTRANEKARDILATEAASTFSLKEKAEALGVEVEGDVSQRSIRRMVTEGGIAAETQLVDEITHARGVTLSGDGTTHKNINYQSHHVTLTLPDGQTATRLAGILHEVNHTSETQLQGWKHQANEMYSTYNDVMGGHNTADIRDFAPKVKGMLTDHAEDQKKLTEGGYQQWDLLSPDERQLHFSKAIRQLRMTFGEKEFASLSSAEKEAVDFFNGVDGPVLLMNKDNSAAASAGSSVAKDWAVQVSTGGGQKTLDLAGSVFRHKDDKKGQHDSLQYYLETELGFTSQWPDTSNTRYHSHGDAACEYLVHKSWYMQFLEIVLFKKESRTHTNMEQNCLIADVDLVFGPSASHETATLDGALDTWVRFCGEFTAGGVIDKSSAAQREMAYMKTTNDDNEGALGTVRTSLRRAPHMSLSHLNSRFMYKKNMTGTYIQNFLRPGAQKRLLKKACAVDTRGDERKRRVAQANYDKERVRKNKQLDVRRKERRDAAEAKLTAVVPRLTLAEVEKLRVDKINLQIQWHR